LSVAGNLHVRVTGNLVIEGADSTLASAGGAFFRASGGLAMAAPFLENAGAPGVGASSDPAEPEPPVMPASFRPPAPKKVVRLPVLGWIGSGATPPTGTMTDDQVLCRFICECDKATKPSGRRESQDCLTRKLRAYDAALGGKSRMKPEVPYDMGKKPPAPIMDPTNPSQPTKTKPAGSEIPDVIFLKDPTKPPTQKNIEKVVEVKFGKDTLDDDKRLKYQTIAGTAPMQVWTPETCGCGEEEREKQRVPVPNEALEAALIACMILLLILDDLVGGVADDVAIPPLVIELAKRLGPLFKPGMLAP
jgi:type VI secretion system secreted protein VgrG